MVPPAFFGQDTTNLIAHPFPDRFFYWFNSMVSIRKACCTSLLGLLAVGLFHWGGNNRISISFAQSDVST